MTISFNQFVWHIVKQLHELSPDALDAGAQDGNGSEITINY